MSFGQALPSRGGMGGREAWNTWVSFSFLLKGKENKIVWSIGGASTYLCAKCAASLGRVQGRAPPGNFDFGPFIRRNLVESGTVVAQT